MKGLEPFRSWDETYVHTKHNDEGPHRPPVPRRRRAARSRGPGSARTARAASSTPPGATTSGPGATPASTTWSSAASAGPANKGDVVRLAGRAWPTGLKPFEYEPAEIPFYTAGRAVGHAGRADHARCRSRSPPDESMKHMVDARRLRGQAVRRRAARSASRSRMTWDDRGRLWVAETVDYPNEMQPQGQGPRPDHDLRGHRRRRQGRQVHRLRREAEHPDEPAASPTAA